MLAYDSVLQVNPNHSVSKYRERSILVKSRETDFPDGSVVKNQPANAGNIGLIPGLRRSPGEGKGNPLLYSWLGNLMDRGTCGLKSMGS